MVDWDIKIQNNNISVPNICLNYAYLLNEVYKHNEIQKEEEEKEEETSQFDYNPPSDTNQSCGKTINMCLSEEENMKIIDEERCKKNDEEQDDVNKGKITPLKINMTEISKTPSEKKTKLKEKSRKRCPDQESDTKNYGFNIEGSDPSDFLEYLDKHTTESFKSTLDILNENIPKIHNSLVALKSYTKGIDKILKKIPYQINPQTNKIILKCGCCILHCPQNWNMSSSPGHPAGNSIKKKKI